MKRTVLVAIISSLSLVACAQQDDEDKLYRPTDLAVVDTAMFVTFNYHPVGSYTDNQLTADFKNIKWVMTSERAKIVEDAERGKVLEVFFPKGSVGPQQGGIQFVRNLPPNKEYYLDYYLKFDAAFDFNLGGKLPGLTSGGETYTGGVHPTEGQGWSARYMWTDKMPVVYLYYVDMNDTYGESLALSTKFEKGKWYRITQFIKINDYDKTNAEITVWLDGKVVAKKQNFRLRIGTKGLIDSFYFSTFHGGNTTDWAARNDCYIYFDNLIVTTKPIKF